VKDLAKMSNRQTALLTSHVGRSKYVTGTFSVEYWRDVEI